MARPCALIQNSWAYSGQQYSQQKAGSACGNVYVSVESCDSASRAVMSAARTFGRQSAMLTRFGFVERASLGYPSSSLTMTSFISLISVITMARVPARSKTIPVARTYLPTKGMSTWR